MTKGFVFYFSLLEDYWHLLYNVFSLSVCEITYNTYKETNHPLTHCPETVTVSSTFKLLSMHQNVTEMAVRPLCLSPPPSLCALSSPTHHPHMELSTFKSPLEDLSAHTSVSVNNEGFKEEIMLGSGHNRIVKSH